MAILQIIHGRDVPSDLARVLQPKYIRPMAVSSPDLKAFLPATPFFGGLSDASLDLLVSMLVERHFDAGVTVVAEGEPGRSMFVVHSDELVVSRLGDSAHVIRMTALAPGDFFGEMTLIEMQNRSATVVAENSTRDARRARGDRQGRHWVEISRRARTDEPQAAGLCTAVGFPRLNHLAGAASRSVAGALQRRPRH